MYMVHGTLRRAVRARKLCHGASGATAVGGRGAGGRVTLSPSGALRHVTISLVDAPRKRDPRDDDAEQ